MIVLLFGAKQPAESSLPFLYPPKPLSRGIPAPYGVWTTYTTAQGLAANAVSTLAVDGDGTLWAGTCGGGLSRFDGSTWISYAKGHGLGDDWVTALAIRDSEVWAGTWGGGISSLDDGHWQTYNTENSGLASDWVTALAVDGEGTLWIGTYGGGLSRFDGGTWRTYNRANGSTERSPECSRRRLAEVSGLADDRVTALAVDGGGALWIGTSGHGVSRFDKGTWVTYTTRDGLASNAINAIAADPAGRVWVGTDEGISVFDGSRWITYTPDDGLAHRRVHAIAFDTDGNAWFGTSRGATRFDGESWITYTQQDGLAHDYVQAIAVDQRGNLWFGTMGGLSKLQREPSRTLGEPGAVLPTPYPVVFVHGWRGPESDSVHDSQFKFLRRWLARDGIASFFATGIRPENTLYQNARRLQEFIAQVRAETGAPKVSIVAHSMGGLNVRAYTESALYQGDVARVFMLGTPQAGVHLWKDFLVREMTNRLAGLSSVRVLDRESETIRHQRGSMEPSARELLPEHMALFNRVHRNVHGIPYHLIIGDVRRQPALEFLDFWPPNDGLITVWSAHALDGPTVQRITTDDVHGWSPGTILFDLPSYLWPADDYRAYLRNELRLGERAPISTLTEGRASAGRVGPKGPYRGQASGFSEAPTCCEPLRPRPENHTPYLWGEIRSGQVVTHTVEIDPNRSARFYLLWRWGDADLTLTDPRGEVVDPDRARKEDGIEHFSLEADVFANLEVYSVEEALPGTWTLTIEGVDLPSFPPACGGDERGGGVDYVAYAVLESDLSLAVATDREWVRRGETVTITATVTEAGEPLPGATVRAEITPPDGVIRTLVLHDDGAHGDGRAGDGVYGTVYTAEVGGYIPVVVTASGAGYQRAQATFIVVSPETARLVGSYADHPQDADGDGVYESLIVEVGVDVVTPGEFALAVVLTDTEGREVTRTVLPTALPGGNQKVAVPLEGALIRASGLDGPYTVSQVILLDISGAAVKLDEAADVHRTRAYSHRDFG